MLPTTQFVYWKGLGTCDALLYLCYILQSTLKSGQDARIVQVDFSAAFNGVNHQGILYKLSSVSIYWRFCVVYIVTVSIKPITARYDGWLLK